MPNPALFGETVYDVDRCPQCGVASPLLTLVFKPVRHYKDAHLDTWWHFTASCSRCSRHVLFYGWTNSNDTPSGETSPKFLHIKDIYPEIESASEELPERAQCFLQQALDSKHAPDGALMLAASAIDAMLKAKDYKAGSLYNRIESAQSDGLLTCEMRDWAHEIRLSANEPRHADDTFDGATTSDAEQSIQFAKALGEYLFVLPSRVKKWKTTASNVAGG